MDPYFQWTHEHKSTSIGRAYFDARYGRVSLALQRLEDLDQIFSQDSDLALAEGVVRLNFLGEGLQTRSLFEKSFSLNQNNAAASKNATLIAMSANEFKDWSRIALPINSGDSDFQHKTKLINESLNEGQSFWEILLLRVAAAADEKHRDFGVAAALAEIVLVYKDEMGSERELSVRRTRAKCLRELDKDVANRRQALCEFLPPEERLSLQKAVAEMDEILKLDEFDPEMWNFKSAWCSLLHRFDEAVSCADRALELRPHGYPKPILNKCDVLLKQKKYDEALVFAKKALAIAQSSNYKSDIPLAQGVIKRATHPLKPHTEQSLPGYSSEFLRAATGVSEKEIAGKGSINKLADGVMLRLMNLRDSQNTTAVMAELTADFSPETVWRTLQVVLTKDTDLFEAGITGMLYSAMQPHQALRRDAARFLSLTILSAGTTDSIRTCYRRIVLTPAQADPVLYPLLSMVEQELRRINYTIPLVITDQPLPTLAEIQQFKNPPSKFGDLNNIFKIYPRSRFGSKIRPEKDVATRKTFGTIGSFMGAIFVFRWVYGAWTPVQKDLWNLFANDPQAKSALLYSLIGLVVGGLIGQVIGTIFVRKKLF